MLLKHGGLAMSAIQIACGVLSVMNGRKLLPQIPAKTGPPVVARYGIAPGIARNQRSD